MALPKPTMIQTSFTTKEPICGHKGKVAVVVATTDKKYLTNELSISLPISLFLPISSYLPNEDKSKAAEILNKWEEQEREKKLRKNIIIAASAIAAGGLLLYLLCKN